MPLDHARLRYGDEDGGLSMKLVWWVLGVLTSVILISGGAWVGRTEGRVSAIEARVIVLEERFASFQRTQDSTYAGVTEILKHMQRDR